ncbi:MAG: hypothetical protein ACRD44_03505, partial [Bryobacteraceae bacterium]
MRKRIPLLAALAAGLPAFQAPQSDIVIKIMEGERPVIAVPDLRAGGAAAGLMGELNATLFRDLQESGVFRMAPKSMYPLQIPQQPKDFVPPAETRPGQRPPQRTNPWLTDWSSPPVNANYLTIGYGAEQGGSLVLFGWLFNVNQGNVANAQVFGKLYFGTLDEAGARKTAHDFAADILEKFGQKSLAGTKIYYASN